MSPGLITLLGLTLAWSLIYLALLIASSRADLVSGAPQSIPRKILKSEANGLLIFGLLYAVVAGLHFKFGSPKIREVERQALFAAGVAVVCYLLVMLLRLRALRKLKAHENSFRFEVRQ